jgi:hypothetical protein
MEPTAAAEVSTKKTQSVRELGPVDISELRTKVLSLTPSDWEKENSEKPNRFSPLGRTQHIIFQFVRDYDNHIDVVNYPIWDDWRRIIEPVLAVAVLPYGYKNGKYSRIMLASLPAQGKILFHVDPYKSSVFTHKIHIPIVTNPSVEFWVDDQIYYFKEGHAYEVNNKTKHGGVNRGSSERINLIFEYYDAQSA